MIDFGTSVEKRLRSQLLTRRKLLDFVHGVNDSVHAFSNANLVGSKFDAREVFKIANLEGWLEAHARE